MKKLSILSVDDDDNLQTVLRHYLEDDGYDVFTVNNVSSAIEHTTSSHYDVVLLDLVLPDGEGLTLIPRIRQSTSAALIVVSGKSDTTEKIVCLEMGADDYVTKPFELRELTARIKAVLRRTPEQDDIPASAPALTQTSGQEKVNFKGWCLDRTQFQLFNPQNQSANLTAGEFKLMEAFVLAPNRVLTREHLFDLTRGQDYNSYDRAIDIQIARLRKKLEEDASLIKTVRGIGYMFCAEVDPN